MGFVDWFMTSFLYCFPYSYCSSNYCDSNNCRFFTLLKAIAKSKSTHIAIAFKIERERAIIILFLFAIAFKSDNYRGSNREKSNFAIAILEKFSIWTYPIIPFKLHMIGCNRLSIITYTKRFYTRGTIRGIRISRLAKIPNLYRDWLSSLN